MHCFGVSTIIANMTANICSVSITGPIGMDTHADTPKRAIVNATNAIERVRDAPIEPCFTLFASMLRSSSRTILRFPRTISKPRSFVNRGV